MYVQQQTEIVGDINGDPTSIIGTLQDISELKSAEALVNHHRDYDSLTDLPNRKKFIKRAKKLVEHSNHHEELFTICLVSIDKLKNINETLGHDIADEVIMAYTQRLKKIDTGNVYISRYHDDTFALLVTGLNNFNQLNELVQQIMSFNDKPVRLEKNELHIQTSIGLSLYPIDNDDFDTILKGAENALNRACQNGGNQSVFYSEKMNQEAHNRLEMEQDMRKALEREEFVVYYQPQVDTKSGIVRGMEALVRWQHPKKGLIPPFAFIPIAEETGLIKQLGAIVLREACKQTKVWNDAGIGNLRVGINLSAKQMVNADFHDEVISILDESRLPPSLLDLEITESMAVQDIDNIIAILGKFQDKGITISMDDFGTGYSALSYLRQLPLDIIKIDRSFVKDIGEGDNGSIAKAVIAVSHSLGMSVIAEGVETEVQLKFMVENNCEEIQGFYYSQPLPADEFEAFVIQHNAQAVAAS
jgi:diguanylate cyclase (GGDEF)-like protein